MAARAFGKITVSSAGTPVRATVNESTPTARVGLQSFTVFALAGNTGANIYVGSSTMNKSTYAGIYAIIPKGSSASFTINLSPTGFNLADIYIDADTSGDLAVISGTEQ